jgi:hypothetical protein
MIGSKESADVLGGHLGLVADDIAGRPHAGPPCALGLSPPGPLGLGHQA